MRLAPKALIYGVHPVILRDCAEKIRSLLYFRMNDFSRALGATNFTCLRQNLQNSPLPTYRM
jgi:hypothetical protein